MITQVEISKKRLSLLAFEERLLKDIKEQINLAYRLHWMLGAAFDGYSPSELDKNIAVINRTKLEISLMINGRFMLLNISPELYFIRYNPSSIQKELK